MRIIAIDFGTKRIGLAVTDNNQKLSSPLTTVLAGKNMEKTIDAILKEVAAYLPESAKIIVGMPYLKDGSKGPMAELVDKFINRLRPKVTIPVEEFDERLSSYAAQSLLKEACLSSKKKDNKLDAAAAAVILQDYLGAQC